MRGVEAVRILRPLRHRDFRLLAVGSLVSLLGDGFFLAAITLQVYALRNEPTAVSQVGLVWAGAAVAFLLVGGWASDRFPRRSIMISADLVRAAAIGGLGLLSISGQLELWHMVVLGGVFGAGNAFFNPASTAIVPDLLPPEDLPQANAFMGTARPLMRNLIGPAIGGLVVAGIGPGYAFLLDAATFLFSAVMLAGVRVPASRVGTAMAEAATGQAMLEGLRYVRAHTWCWAWMLGAALSLLAFLGPQEVLLPFLLLNDASLDLSETDARRQFGFILAVGGLGSILMSLVVGQRSLPRRYITAMFVAEATAVALLAVYGTMTAVWQALAASFVMNALFAFTDIAWTTTLQREVPRHLLGRVSSLDWFTALGLVPLSFAIAGPLGVTFGARQILVAGGVVGAAVLLSLLFVPGARAPERQGRPAAVPAASASIDR